LLTLSQFGVFEEHYSANQLKDQPLSTISWIGSLQLSLILLMGCVSGPLFDAGVSRLFVPNSRSYSFFFPCAVSQVTHRVGWRTLRILSVYDINLNRLVSQYFVLFPFKPLSELYQFVLSQGLGVGVRVD
jgi:hypothetical protein